MPIADFKYRKEIEELINGGIQLPPLYPIDNKLAYRFVFSTNSEKNHIPVYKQNPRRVITAAENNKLTTSGFALSCFENEGKAIEKFNILKGSMRNIALAIGDSLSFGVLVNSDGLITNANAESHFDLYEYKDCDLSKKFTVKGALL